MLQNMVKKHMHKTGSTGKTHKCRMSEHKKGYRKHKVQYD